MNTFLNRVKTFQCMTFVIVNVQALTSALKECIFHFLSRNSEIAGEISFHCIQHKSSTLPVLPWVNNNIWDFNSGLKLPSVNASRNKLKQLHEGIHGWIKDFSVVSSTSGGGKTRYIKTKMGKLCTGEGYTDGTFYLNEGFQIGSAIRFLSKRFQGVGSKKVVHFILSFGPSEDIQRRDLLKMIHSFFLSFIFIGHLYDPQSGLSFDIRQYEWSVFFEYQLWNETEDGILWLNTFLPAVACIANFDSPPSEFEIDSKANRVCTYLRAFSDGTINRKFVPLSKRIVFVLDESGSMSGSKANQAVNSIIQLFDSHVQIGDVSGCTVLHFYIEGYIFIDCNF